MTQEDAKAVKALCSLKDVSGTFYEVQPRTLTAGCATHRLAGGTIPFILKYSIICP
jgi:hypothetical protein